MESVFIKVIDDVENHINFTICKDEKLWYQFHASCLSNK